MSRERINLEVSQHELLTILIALHILAKYHPPALRIYKRVSSATPTAIAIAEELIESVDKIWDEARSEHGA